MTYLTCSMIEIPSEYLVPKNKKLTVSRKKNLDEQVESSDTDLDGCSDSKLPITTWIPNLVLLQYLNDIPIEAKNIVYWSFKVFNEKLTDKLESITKLFDDPSVLNPFVNGALSNRYGDQNSSISFWILQY
ncbi:hypothetical protein CRE_29059 [Caenorhabditis remanei]|uniref:Uncharacterized protein n=1 Tax=Caenorhabditis remanei TaxID=31234 RepID=E3MWB4_CAERE|nr:hypothetical protein CRE_29059 [Caenorhabditis remanei]